MKTLQELEGKDWGDPTPDETGMVQRCKVLRRKLISDFDDEDLRLMIGQQIGIDHLVPVAIDVLAKNPFASGDMFEGALIETLSRIEAKWWPENPAEEARFRSIIERIDWSKKTQRSVKDSADTWIKSR